MSNTSLTAFLALSPEIEDSIDPPCGICRGPFRRAVRTPCSHMFCLAGILSWLDCSDTCLTCRRPLFEQLPLAECFSFRGYNGFPQTLLNDDVLPSIAPGAGRLDLSSRIFSTRNHHLRLNGGAMIPNQHNLRSPPLSPSSLSYTRFLHDNPTAPLHPSQQIRFNARILLSATDRAMLRLTSPPCTNVCRNEWRRIRNLLGLFFHASAGIIVSESAAGFHTRLQRLLQYSPIWDHRDPYVTVLNEEMSQFREGKDLLILWIVKRAARLHDVQCDSTGSQLPPA